MRYSPIMQNSCLHFTGRACACFFKRFGPDNTRGGSAYLYSHFVLKVNSVFILVVVSLPLFPKLLSERCS